MNRLKFSLKWKLIGSLVLIGFTTSFIINLSFWLVGTHKVSYNMAMHPISNWQNKNISDKLKLIDKNSVEKSSTQQDKQSSINQYLASLVNTQGFDISYIDEFYTQLFISHVAVVNLQSQLVFQTADTGLAKGDVGNQIPIASRDDLSDALVGHYNSGVELLDKNSGRYLVIRSIKNSNDEITGATLSWQSWQAPAEKPLFYISIKQAILNSLASTLASFIWILPSTFILGLLVARIITNRYQHLYLTIEDWGKGHLKSQIKTTGNDEISTSFKRLNQMAENLSRHQKELKQLISIEERQQLAAELHDTVKQQLFATNLQLSSASQQLDSSPEQAKQTLQTAIEQNRIAFKQVNDLIFTLSPIPIGGSLKEALIKAFDNWQQNNGIKLNTQLEVTAKLTEIQQQTIFRSIMEALQNCSKHSDATEVMVNLTQTEQTLCWSIKDNGTTQSKVLPKLGQGLSLMEKRLEPLNGTLNISTDNGFQLNASLPYE